MSWNEPGGSGGKDRDPWGGGGNNKNQGPPDLDEALKKFQEKLSGIFGGGPKKGGNGNTPFTGKAGGMGFGVIGVIAVVVWLASGIYIVDPAERGVVTMFGKYTTSTMPGPHWHLPYPIETVTIVNVDEVRTLELGFRQGRGGGKSSSVNRESLMLSQDENIVDIELAVQYKIKDAANYLFNVRNPDSTLRQAGESAVRDVVGKSMMDFVLTEGRGEIAIETRDIIQKILDAYGTGLIVTTVNMQKAQPPHEVKDAFDDAIKAREDEQRLKNEAEAYSNDIIPKARGASARQIEEANAYKEQVIAQAEGESNRFISILREYEKAPTVTRERLYIETMEQVLSSTSKVMVDVKGGNNLMYLPLDKLAPAAIQRATSSGGTGAPMTGLSAERDQLLQEVDKRVREQLRNRGTR